MNAESKEHADDKIYSKQMINDIMETMSDQMDKNNPLHLKSIWITILLSKNIRKLSSMDII